MSSLYRKWRSRSFDDLVGQDHVVRTLRNAVAQGRVAHAYVFTGPRGTGKTSTARILAKAVNCLDPRDGNPCNECAMCVAANDGRALDVIEIDAASNTSVENVRDLRERVAYAAGEGRFKVYIVDEVHRLSGAAFDAFLKTLEEPPEHVIFVFASTEPHKVPATIMSRCQRFDFRRHTAETSYDRVHFVADQEGIEVADDALRLIVRGADGSLRDALNFLDLVSSYTEGAIKAADVRRALGLVDVDLVARLTDYLLEGEVGKGLTEIAGFLEAGGDPGQLTRQFVEYWRALLLRATGAPADDLVDPMLVDRLAVHVSRLNQAQIVAVIRAMVGQDVSGKFNLPPELPFEVGFVQASLLVRSPAPAPASSPSEDVPPPPRTPAHAPRAPTPDPPAPEPERPAVARADAGNLDETWSTVVSNMRLRSRSLQAVLRSGYLLKLSEGEMTVGFLFDFHRDQFSDTKKRKLLEDVVAETFGVQYRVTCVRVTKEEVAATRGEPVIDDGFVEEAAERLRRFHMQQLGNGHS